MVASASEAWYAPELRAALAFGSDFIPLFLTFLPLIVLWRTPFARAFESQTLTKVFLLALLSVFVQYEVVERELGIIGSRSFWREPFFAIVIAIQSCGGMFYFLEANERFNIAAKRSASKSPTESKGSQTGG